MKNGKSCECESENCVCRLNWATFQGNQWIRNRIQAKLAALNGRNWNRIESDQFKLSQYRRTLMCWAEWLNAFVIVFAVSNFIFFPSVDYGAIEMLLAVQWTEMEKTTPSNSNKSTDNEECVCVCALSAAPLDRFNCKCQAVTGGRVRRKSKTRRLALHLTLWLMFRCSRFQLRDSCATYRLGSIQNQMNWNEL